MAARLASNDAPVAVYARSKRDNVDSGLAWCTSPKDVGTGTDQVFLMLPTAEATREVLEGPHGLLSALRPDSIVINSATIGPEAAEAIGHLVTESGAAYLDAPVLGSTGAAEQGQLLFLVGGAEEILARCRPALERLGRRILHVGGTGRGSAAKLLFNAQLGTAMAALADTLRLAAALDLPQRLVLDEVLPSPVTAPALAAKKGMLADGAFEPQFALKWMVKDLMLAEASAAHAGVTLPVVAAALARYQEAARAGFGEEDFVAVGRY
jgi:3-hydroxyisobutyrate dehydrogenase-like beta-hydroxyacid dehydrogenase